MDWELNLSPKTRAIMRDLGNFSPTFHAENREVKGYMLDGEGESGKVYWTSKDLHEIASACLDVADWLDRRAEE